MLVDPNGTFVVSGTIAVSYASYAVAGMIASGILYYGAPIAADIGQSIGAFLTENRHSPDREALNDIIDETTLGGRRPLSGEDADTVLDWADELGIEGARDDRATDHWAGGSHIHVPGSGINHIPANFSTIQK
jgi:hypothetical protein